jgi:hypothetical protein
MRARAGTPACAETHAVVMVEGEGVIPHAFKKNAEHTPAYRRGVEKICCRVDFRKVRST